MTQDAYLAQVVHQLVDLSPSEILRTIKKVEHEITNYLQEIARSAKSVSEKERDEHLAAYFKHGGYYYRALTLLLEKNDVPELATIYRARAELYNNVQHGRIDIAQFEEREAQNEASKLSALTLELATLEKGAPLKKGTLISLGRLGDVISEAIFLAAAGELGDPPDVHAFNQGMIALGRDDYPKVAQLLRPLAERGDPRSQFWIGYMHLEGLGLPQDFSQALKWLQRSADHGENGAQYQLAGMYAEANGVPRDLVSAYMWLSIAASQGHEKSTKGRDELGAHLTREQIAEATKRASEWKPKTPAIGPAPTIRQLRDEIQPAPRPIARTIRLLIVRTIGYAAIAVPVLFGVLFFLFYSPCSTGSLVQCLLHHNIVQGALMNGFLLAFIVASQRTFLR
jgi:hypothetical protein